MATMTIITEPVYHGGEIPEGGSSLFLFSGFLVSLPPFRPLSLTFYSGLFSYLRRWKITRQPREQSGNFESGYVVTVENSSIPVEAEAAVIKHVGERRGSWNASPPPIILQEFSPVTPEGKERGVDREKEGEGSQTLDQG